MYNMHLGTLKKIHLLFLAALQHIISSSFNSKFTPKNVFLLVSFSALYETCIMLHHCISFFFYCFSFSASFVIVLEILCIQSLA